MRYCYYLQSPGIVRNSYEQVESPYYALNAGPSQLVDDEPGARVVYFKFGDTDTPPVDLRLSDSYYRSNPSFGQVGFMEKRISEMPSIGLIMKKGIDRAILQRSFRRSVGGPIMRADNRGEREWFWATPPQRVWAVSDLFRQQIGDLPRQVTSEELMQGILDETLKRLNGGRSVVPPVRIRDLDLGALTSTEEPTAG